MADRHRLATDTENGLLLIISGPSGVGKTTLTRGVERSIPDAIFSVSATTRAKTDADVEGVDYHFVDRPEFERMIGAGELLEWAEVYGQLYGTPREWVYEQKARGRVVILEIDVQGAAIVKKAVPEALAVFVLPPSEETLLERLRGRRREPEEQIRKRFEQARREIVTAEGSGVYDRFIVNDDLAVAVEQVVGMVGEVRATRGR